jgi:hypothetical protein
MIVLFNKLAFFQSTDCFEGCGISKTGVVMLGAGYLFSFLVSKLFFFRIKNKFGCLCLGIKADADIQVVVVGIFNAQIG